METKNTSVKLKALFEYTCQFTKQIKKPLWVYSLKLATDARPRRCAECAWDGEFGGEGGQVEMEVVVWLRAEGSSFYMN